jgi:hypothetical protein
MIRRPPRSTQIAASLSRSQAAEYKKFRLSGRIPALPLSHSEKNNLFSQIAFRWDVKPCGPTVGRALAQRVVQSDSGPFLVIRVLPGSPRFDHK